jgi:hypothetical protein
MLTRYRSEDHPNIFVPSHEIEGDISTENGVAEFDNPSDNPYPSFPYLVRVGSGYRAFQKKIHALTYYRED